MKTSPLDKTEKISKSQKRIFILEIFLIAAAISVGPISSAVSKSMEYKECEKLVVEGEYSQAAQRLEQFDDEEYKDVKALLHLCQAHVYYDSGDISEANSNTNIAENAGLPDYLTESFAGFKSKVKKDYEIYWEKYVEEKKERERKEAEERERQYEYYRKHSVPRVGMAESEVDGTSLGHHQGKIRHNYECINGKQYLANLYDFYDEDGYRIFSARCVNGKVTNVWDERNDERTIYTPRVGGSSSRGSSGSKKNNSGKKKNKGPSVDGFSDPEDFYDWYYDDFYDYEDAEDYYYEHGGE